MASVSDIQQNWVSGELSPYMRGRFDIPVYKSGAEKLVNYVSETSGAARFRSGTQFVNPTRRNQVACLLPFQFNENQAYILEFTQGYIRFYQSDQVVTASPLTITGVTNATTGVVTSASHGLSNGQEVIVNGIVGMPRMNNRNFVVMGVTTDTFQLYDVFGTTPVDTTSFGTYSSGGTASQIYEVASPYQLADLFTLKYGQNADVLYIVDSNYEPMKLTRMGNASWTLTTFTRTADPFTAQQTVSAITQANPGVITATAHGYSNGQKVIFNGIGGMTQLNNGINGTMYIVQGVTTDTFTLTDLNGNVIDTSGYGAYTSGGYVSDATLLPGAFCFYQGRSQYAGSEDGPESWWGSKSLDINGNPQYDDFTTGTDPTDSYKFTLSPITGKVDRIFSLVPTLNYLALCTLEGISKATGDAAGDSISPSTVDVQPAVTYGVLQQVTPILLGINMIYIHRSALIMYSLEFDIFYNAYNAIDKNLTNEHITQSGITQMVYRNGRPPLFLMVRNDGVLIGTTFMVKENINGAHRIIFGGANVHCWSVGNMPRPTQYDQTWVVIERLIDGQTVRYVEYINDEVVFPEQEEFYTSDENEVSDHQHYLNDLFEVGKGYVFLDCNATYDGSLLATQTMTPGATTGTGITFTAGGSVFKSSMVGQQIWKKAVKGIGSGRAEITSYISATQVTCQILSDFDNTNTMPVSGWYLTTATLTELWYLEGETVGVITDGGEAAQQVVINGQITNEYQSSVIQVGEPYLGLIKSMPVEIGGVNGPAVGKNKNVNRLAILFLNTLGARYGTSLYDLQEVDFRTAADSTGRPSPVFTGVKPLQVTDSSEYDKHIFIMQQHPLPCIVLGISPFCDTDNEP